MGVIKKLLFRKNALSDCDYENQFLDMEENIHIHYRDLRIELSRNEFEDFQHIFSVQSKELMEIIEKQQYQDGKLANANQKDVRIWTDSKLNHSISYHQKRISIEECSDGFHLHLRNYKLLLRKDDFLALREAMIESDPKQVPLAENGEQIIQLLVANEVDFALKEKHPEKDISTIFIADYHLNKLIAITQQLGMTQGVFNKHPLFKKKQTLLIAIPLVGKNVQLLKKLIADEHKIVLSQYLEAIKDSVDANELNLLKCQVLDYFAGAKKNIQEQKSSNLALNYKQWLYDPENQQIQFLATNETVTEQAELLKAQQQWDEFLQQQQLYFVKPGKQIYQEAKQQQTIHNILDLIVNEIVAIKGVERIYIMGSMLRQELGIYSVPFVHGMQAKLGSDIDILIELESSAIEIPAEWKLKNLSNTNSCYIYHLSEVALEDKYAFKERFSNIEFLQHLIDAYVYIPGKSDEQKKNDFLQQFNAKCCYSIHSNDAVDIPLMGVVDADLDDPWQSEDGMDSEQDNEPSHKQTREEIKQDPANEEKTEHEIEQDPKLTEIADFLATQYQFSDHRVHYLKAASENGLYHVHHKQKDYVLKIFKVSGNYSSSRLLEHCQYEAKFITSLIKQGVYTPSIVADAEHQLVSQIKGVPCMLYTLQQGKVYKRPEPDFPIEEATYLLARLHTVQTELPILESSGFSFDDVFNLWFPVFQRFRQLTQKDAELQHCFNQLEAVYLRLPNYYERIMENTTIPRINNHGDINPRNFVIENHQASIVDFQNAFFGPRLFDIVDGAFEFSFGGKPPAQDDFSRFESFLSQYQIHSPLSYEEINLLDDVIKCYGIIKFIKEVRMIKGSDNPHNLRRIRALNLAEFLIDRYDL